MLEENEVYRLAWESSQNFVAVPDTGQEFNIPVVFHVIHLGENTGSGSNVSEGRINGAVNKLNNNYLIPFNNDIGIRFCLATRDPNGSPTNGIVRVDGRSVANYQSQGLESSAGPGADETEVKNLSRWPNSRYYNIWVVHNIAGSVAGYAYYPTTFINDGTSIEAGSVNNSSTLLSHEIGHAFNLRHTFNGDNNGNSCPTNDVCLLQGDYICDTPPHKRTDCFISTSCSPNDPNFANSAENFMSYCPVKNRFTSEQRVRMRTAANTSPRIWLSTSNSCEPLPDLDGNMVEIQHPSEAAVNNYCDDELLGNFLLSNVGNLTINTFGIIYSYDGFLQTASYTTDLQSGETQLYFLPPASLNTSIDFHMLEVVITTINEGDDENPLNDTARVIFEINDSCVSTGVQLNLFTDVSIYPNPAFHDVLYVKGITAYHRIVDVEIRNPLGQLYVAEEISYTKSFIDIGDLASGTYFLTLRSEGHLRSMKIIRY